MPTLLFLLGFLMAVALSGIYVTWSKTSSPAKATPAGTTTTPTTSRGLSLRTVLGRRQRELLDSMTPSTPTTSGETLPGSSVLSPTPAAPPDGPTAGTSATSHDCAMWRAGMNMLAQVAQSRAGGRR